MKRLKYKLVFTKYNKSLSYRLSECAYHLYKVIRPKTAKIFPLKGIETVHFDETDSMFWDDSVLGIPSGFNYKTQVEEEGYIHPVYIDLFDYLPKEELPKLKKKLKRFIQHNGTAMFSAYRTDEDLKKLDNIGAYTDYSSFSNFCTIVLKHNPVLENYAPNVCISLINLSTSFLAVRYRFCISKSFQALFTEICAKGHTAVHTISKSINTHWFTPWRFGMAEYICKDSKEQELYEAISRLKWEMFKELKKHFHIHLADYSLFPPSFDTFRTNIRPDKKNSNSEFWRCFQLSASSDYSPKLNACLSWEYNNSFHEGTRLMLFCGGDYPNVDMYPGLAEYHLSEQYTVYLLSHDISRCAKAVLQDYNDQISKAIKSRKTSKILKTRVLVRKKLFYAYRFLKEFTGSTIAWNDLSAFRCCYNKKSWSVRVQEHLTTNLSEQKEQIDHLLELMDNMADYKEAKTNMRIQTWMVPITILSLIVALFSISEESKAFLLSKFQSIYNFLRSMFSSFSSS